MPSRRRTLVFLAAILAASVLVRLLPLAPFALWGSDSGEYLLLTEHLVANGALRTDYDGWGIAYPFFPGLFVVDGAAELVLGLAPLDALRYTIPVLAALVLPLGVFLLARRLTGDLRVALVAAAFLALTPVNALVTSHPMPGTLGHVFVLAAVVALAHAYDDRGWAPLAALSALAVVPSHHLSTWFLAGALAAAFVLREGARRRWDVRATGLEAGLLALVVALAGAWWLGFAAPFRDEILGALGVPAPAVAAAGYGLLLLLPAAVVARRRLLPGPVVRVAWPGPLAKAALVAGTGLALVGGLLLLFATGVPGGNIHPTRTTVAFALPNVAWIAFSLVGLRELALHRRGGVVVAWSAAILASLVFAVATESRVLFPFRHPDYLVAALAVPIAIGMTSAYEDVKQAAPERDRVRLRRAAAWALGLMLAVTFLMSQPPREAIGGFEEGTTDAELALVAWAAEGLPDGAVVVADHRLSSLLFGLADARPTWDSAADVYHAEDRNATASRLACVDILADECRPAEYVALSSVIAEGVVTVQWEDALPMSDAALAKFFDAARFRIVHEETRGEREWAVLLRVLPPPG